MGTVIVRRVASTPVRTATQTWQQILEILAPDPKSSARKELAIAAGVACASISSEATKDAAIVVRNGGGPRVRVYCIFDDDAMTGDGVTEDALPKSPTEGDWKMSIPCLSEDVAWSRAELAAIAHRIAVRSADEEIEDEPTKSDSSKSSLTINLEEFLKS
jgi:hypothetical protein